MADESIDDSTVARVISGDADALETCLRKLEPELRAGISIQPLWRRSLDASDVLQVSFMEAFLRIRSLRDATPAGLRSWLKTIVQNNLTDAIRGLERDKRPNAHQRVTHGVRGESARTLLAEIIGKHSTAGARASAKEEVEKLLAAVEKLPESYRRVVREVDLAERSVDEVSAEMRRSTGAVHMLRSRALVRLRELLESRS